jgi:hypothetical protein
MKGKIWGNYPSPSPAHYSLSPNWRKIKEGFLFLESGSGYKRGGNRGRD